MKNDKNPILLKKSTALLLVFGCLLVAFSSVLIFTRNSFSPFFDLTKTGQIGDTIGGITAPIINLFGYVLVFFSFREQYKANQIQLNSLEDSKNEVKKTQEFELLMRLIENLDRKIDNFEFIVQKDAETKPYADTTSFFEPPTPVTFITYKGATGIDKFSDDLTYKIRNVQNIILETKIIAHLADYYYIIKYLYFVKMKIIDSFLSIDSKKILSDQLLLIYEFKLYMSLADIVISGLDKNLNNRIYLDLKKVWVGFDEELKLIQNNSTDNNGV